MGEVNDYFNRYPRNGCNALAPSNRKCLECDHVHQPPQSPDPRDVRIAELQANLNFAQGECQRWQSDYHRLQCRVQELERELENAKTLWARSIEQVCEEQTEALRLREALEGMKKDCEWYHHGGTHQERHHFVAVELVDRIDQALAAHSPDTSMKQEKSDTLAGPVDSRDTSASCSERAGTEPSCAPSHLNFPGIRCDNEQVATGKSEEVAKFHEICPTPEQVRRLEDEAKLQSELYARNWDGDQRARKRRARHYRSGFVDGYRAALKDSGWRG